MNLLGVIVFWHGPMAGASNDGRLYQEYCPWRLIKGWGLGDGAYGNRPRLVIPCRKTNGNLSAAGDQYNQIHSFFRARSEHVFGFLWHFALIRQPWTGQAEVGASKLFDRVKVLINFSNFYFKRCVRYEPYGPWSHHPPPSAAVSPEVAPHVPSQPAQREEVPINRGCDTRDDGEVLLYTQEVDVDDDFPPLTEPLPRLTRRQRHELGV